ncbi:MAG: dTDP-4-dehydrorhamnose 3,5-epimerase [Ruminococcaceae bacterium]|nr:dTDP-4-dehydrorhamnose 3,5-epimerase [Oscillospiraceae bacterium]
MKVTELEIPGVFLIEPDVFRDDRGYYTESYSARTLAKFGIKDVFVQDNHFLSVKPRTIRGIHFQNVPYSQAKLLRCTKGKVLNAIVDLRKGSKTYMKWLSVELSEENKLQLYVPKGFGNACMSLVENCEVQYKVSELYYPEYDRAILWNDPEIGIEWGEGDVVLSAKDAVAPTVRESDVNYTTDNTK